MFALWSAIMVDGLSRKPLEALRRRWDGVLAALTASGAPSSIPAPEAQNWLRAAIDAMPEGIVFLDQELRYILWNERYSEIYKTSADLFKPGARLADTLRIGVERGDYPEAAGREEAWIAERLYKLANPEGPHEQRLADGRWILIEERRMADGCVIGLRVDVTEIKRKEESLRLLFENNPVPMFLYELDTRHILAANDAACSHYLYPRASLIGRDVAIIFDEEIRHMRVNGACRHVKADGTLIETSVFSRELTMDGRTMMLLAAIDVSERRRAEARLAFMARHDALTRLPNRVHFRETVEAMLARVHGQATGFALLLFDLDHFKAVNDTLGHSVGDLLLQDVARRIRGLLGPGDTLARLGGDEFALIHESADVTATAGPLADEIIAEVRRPYDIDGHHVQIGASAGIALAPRDGADPDRLLKNADLALYAAKAEGRGVHLRFDPAMDEALQSRRRLELALRAALHNDELQIYYQPLVDLDNCRTNGFEALLRWRHPERGLVSPGEFVPLAEDTGLIGPIGRMVLFRACADAARWPFPGKLAVNLSPVQFRTCNVLETVVQALAASGLPAERLELEITEALLLERDESVLSTLRGLRALGVGVSMDDFGTGYSSLSYLRAFPFTKIKIDQSFVRDVAHNADSQAIVRAILSLGENLGLSVIAEGVEHAEDVAFLKGMGCKLGQGYYFSRPQPLEHFFPDLVAAPTPANLIEPFTAEQGAPLRKVG